MIIFTSDKNRIINLINNLGKYNQEILSYAEKKPARNIPYQLTAYIKIQII